MRTLALLLASLGLVFGLVVAPAAVLASPTAGWPESGTMNFTVMRDGEPIGDSTVRLSHRGDETVANVSTHIESRSRSLPSIATTRPKPNGGPTATSWR